MELNIAGVLSALAAAAFAGLCGASLATLTTLVLAFGAVVAVVGLLVNLAPTAIGFAVAAGVGLCLARPHWWWLPPMVTGAVAATWVSVLRAQGLPLTGALLVPGGVVAAGVLLAVRRPDFAPAALRDEALLIVGLFALALAVGGDLVAGWRSAAALASEPLAAGGTGGAGLAVLVVGCVAFGGLYSLWKRR